MAHIGKRLAKPKLDTYTSRKPQDKSSLWRVIAPYMTVAKKIPKAEVEDDQFSFYLKKKPTVLLRDLSAFMYDSVDLPSLFDETAQVLGKVTKATGLTLYLVDRATNEIYPSYPTPTRERFRIKWKIKEGTILAAFVAKKREYVLIEDLIDDDRFPEGLGYEDFKNIKSVLCLPVITPDNDCFAVIELSRDLTKPPFSLYDLRICAMVTAWMGVAIQQNQERLALKRQQELNDYLLELVKCYFEDHVLMEKLMSEVVQFAKITLGAERGSFFIIDQDSDELVAHFFDEVEDGEVKKGKTKVRFGKERGIAGLVARTGVTVNIKDAYNDNRFNKEIDQKTGFITRAILCMPILGAQGVLGVVQVVNKKNGGCFTSNDETLFKTFSLYCAMALHYTNVHTQVSRKTNINNINFKMLRLVQGPCIHDIQAFIKEPKVKIPVDFDLFSWYISSVNELEITPQLTLYIMFELINPEEINMDCMMNFILTVKKMYREDIPYHNFEHAFHVCHCMYVILKRNLDKFTKLEVKALLVASLCHDIDHMGFTNSFLALIKHDIAALYETSPMENHHVFVTIKLLEQSNIFPNLSEFDRKLLHFEVQVAILATDLTQYFEVMVQLRKVQFKWQNRTHYNWLKNLAMNAADFSGQCKPFLTARRITENIYREFYRQGDLEKERGMCPLPSMDRENEDSVPQDQMRFLDVVVIPGVYLLQTILPNTEDLYFGAVQLRKTWQEIAENRGQKIWRQDDSIVRHKFYEKFF